MKGEFTYFDKALSNFHIAVLARKSIDNDENAINVIAYLLSQTLELIIKFILEDNGVEYLKTHDIEQLIRIGKDNNVELYLSEYIEDHSEMFTSWEAKTRYIKNYLVEVDKVDKAIENIEKYIGTVAEAYK